MAYTQAQLNQMVQQAQAKGIDPARIQNALRNTIAKQGQAQVQQPHQRSLIAQLAPLLGSVGGSLIGSVALPGLGTAAGGAAGGALGEALAERLSGESYNPMNIAREGAFGGIGGIGEAFQALRGVGTAAKAAEVGTDLARAGKAARGVEEAGRAAGLLNKTKNALEGGATALEQGTRQIRVPASVYGAAKENAINETLNRYGFKGTAQAQYEQLAPTIQKIENQITQVAKANPNVRVGIDELKSSFQNNLKSALRSGVIDSKQAQSEVAKYLGDLATEAGGSSAGKLNLQQLRDMKRLINTDMAGIAKKLETGAALTPREQVINVSWKSIDDSLKNASPEIKSLLKDQSHLYAADSSLSRARTAPPTMRIAGTSVPMPVLQAGREVGSAAMRGASNALGGVSKVAPVLGTAAKVGAGQMAGNALFGNGQPQQAQPDQSMMYQQPQMQDYGQMQGQQSGQQDQQQQQLFLAAMLSDLQRTGGKNIAKIQAIAQFAGAGKGKGLNTTAASQVSQFDNSLANLDEVESMVNSMSGKFGPIKGRLESLNPYDQTQANINQATLVAAQNIGRALEGGKLTDADIARYQKALPSINDTPQVAQDKINRLRRLIQQQRQNYIQNVQGSTSDASSLIGGLNGLLGGSGY